MTRFIRRTEHNWIGVAVFSADTARALGLLDDYCTKLRPEEQQLKTAIQRVMGIFQSNLFEALLGELMRRSRQTGRSSKDNSVPLVRRCI